MTTMIIRQGATESALVHNSGVPGQVAEGLGFPRLASSRMFHNGDPVVAVDEEVDLRGELDVADVLKVLLGSKPISLRGSLGIEGLKWAPLRTRRSQPYDVGPFGAQEIHEPGPIPRSLEVPVRLVKASSLEAQSSHCARKLSLTAVHLPEDRAMVEATKC